MTELYLVVITIALMAMCIFMVISTNIVKKTAILLDKLALHLKLVDDSVYALRVQNEQLKEELNLLKKEMHRVNDDTMIMSGKRFY